MRSFGDLEARVMSTVWASPDPVTVRDVLDDMSADHQVAYTTAITVIERLRAKGWLERARVGRSYRYTATASESDYTAWLMGRALDEASDRSAALLSFTGQLNTSELDALRAALTEDGGSAP